MPHSVQASAQFIDREFLPAFPKNIRLSIQLRLDGFSFALFDKMQQRVFQIEDFSVPLMLGDEAVYQNEKVNLRVENFLNQYSETFSEIEDVQVLVDNPFFTLVPRAVFVEQGSADYLQAAHPLPEHFLIKRNSLSALEIELVFGMYAPLFYTVADRFEQVKVQHRATVFIERSRWIQKNDQADGVYVELNGKQMLVVAFANHKLMLANQYAFKEKEDFIYFLLLVYNQLGLNPETTPLHLFGSIDRRSDEYAIAYQYIRHIHFPAAKTRDSLSSALAVELQSRYFSLIQSFYAHY